MHKRINLTRQSMGLLVIAVTLRLAAPLIFALPKLRVMPNFTKLMLFCSFGVSDSLNSKPHPGVITVKSPETATVVAATPVAYSAEDSGRIHLYSTSSYCVDTMELLCRPLAGNFSGEGPKVLIVHTHGTESYADFGGFSQNADQSVMRVGTEMAAIFEERGIGVIHETRTVSDYDNAYAAMSQIIADDLSRYPSITMVLDVHRDAYEGADGKPGGKVVTVNGQECAQLMLVMGTGENGDRHPNWQGNLSCALKTQALLLRSYPNLCRDLVLRRSDYNQYLTPCSMLVEVGASGNTLEQALRAGRYFAYAVCDVIAADRPGNEY